MSKSSNTNNTYSMSKIGNFTKNAVQSFKTGIVTEHNYLEKVKNNLDNK